MPDVKTADLEAEHRAAVRNLTTEDAVELCNALGISFFLVAIYQMVGIADRQVKTDTRAGNGSRTASTSPITPLRSRPAALR